MEATFKHEKLVPASMRLLLVSGHAVVIAAKDDALLVHCRRFCVCANLLKASCLFAAAQARYSDESPV